MTEMRIAVRGTKRATESLRRYTDNIESWPKTSKDIFAYLAKQTQKTFDNAGRAGVSWPDYWKQEPKYGAQKMRIFNDAGVGGLFPNLLRWMPNKEQLFPSLMIPTHPDAIRVATNEGLTYGTSVEYAAKHQQGKGTNKQGEPVAQRKFLFVVAEDLAEIRRIIAKHVGI